MTPTRLDFDIYGGSRFTAKLTFKEAGAAVDMSAWTFAAQIRKDVLQDVETSFTIDTTNASTGVIVLTLTPTVTASLARAVWDLIGSQSASAFDDPTPFVAGNINVTRGVTRD